MRVEVFGGQELRQSPARLDRHTLLFFVALGLGLVAWIVTGWALPLWFDEVYTGTIANQRTFPGLVRWCLSEITGPAFYMPMWLWAKAAGTSNAALRMPALILSMAAPLLIAWRGHRDRKARLHWAIFTLLWLPMLPMATEARPYPQLVFLGSLQAIAFLRLSRSADRRRALEWTTVTALFVLTNYYALVISALQGLALAASHRARLLKLWPALLPLAPAAAWMVFHLPVVLQFASAHGTMFTPLPPRAVFAIPLFLFGPGMQGFAILILLALTCSSWWGGTRPLSPEAQLVCSGLAAFALIFFVGLFKATLAPRYITPGMPALLFGLGWWASRMSGRKPVAVAAMLGVFFLAVAATFVTGSADDRFGDRRNLQFESASAWLMERPLDRLYYLKPEASPAPDRDAEIAGFFFARAGRPVSVIQTDYRSAMTASLANDRRGGVLFIGDKSSSRELTGWFGQQPLGWTCRDFGQTAFAIVACRPKA